MDVKTNRRSFIKVSTAAGGGLMLGFSWISCKPDAKVAATLPMPDTWFDVNAFLKIGDTGLVSIVSPNPEIGQNVKTSMPMIVAEELGVDWKDVIVEQAGLSKDFDRQVAGGSQSIRKSWDSLRTAGATAREMLVSAAAEKLEVDAESCTVENGIITHSSGKSISFGEVASLASQQVVPTDIKFKDPNAYTIIGTDRKNVDGPAIVNGTPLFGIDTRKDGMLYASVLRPPAFGQSLASYDDTAAKAVSGVKEVIKIGDKIAVLGDSNWSAIKGKKRLKANWISDGKAESTADHDAAMSKILEKSKGESLRKDGDAAKAIAEADFVLDRTYEAPFLPHNCMEPMNFMASVEGDKCYAEGPIQTPQWTQSRIATAIGIEPENVEIKLTRMGGGFGRRLYGDFAEEVAMISQKAGVPIQLLYTREDDMTAGTYRPASKYRIQAAVKDGKLTGYKLTEAAINGNMYGLIAHFFPAGCISNYEVVAGKVESNITTGAWRAPYTNFLGFAEQSFFDELAEHLKIDPVQLRLDLLENVKGTTDENIEYSGERMQGVIRLAAEKSGWGKTNDGVYQGFSAYYSHNTHVAEVAEVVIEDNRPIVKKVYCAVDCGIVINPLAATNQIEGGIIDGIGHAMYGDLSFDKGKPSAANFDRYRLIRNMEAPEVEVHFVQNVLSPTGLGEPSLPPAGGAVANAIKAATGNRFYKQPFIQYNDVIG